jgi:hypothetical protein
MPDRQPTVYLHIGIAKTGTTYLQDILWRERKALAKHGVVYPGASYGAQFLAAVDLRGGEGPLARHGATPGSWDALAAAARSVPDRAVISHETLARCQVEDVRRAVASLAPAEVHIVVTARDLGRQLPATWQERVKNLSAGGYRAFLRKVSRRPKSRIAQRFWENQDIVAVLDRYTQVIPPERVHIVTLPSRGASSGDGLWERFAAVLGLDPTVVNSKVPPSNVSLGVAEAELLRRLNPALRKELDWPTYARAVKTDLSRRLAARGSSPRLGIPAEMRPWVSERAEQMITGLKAGGYDVVGDLAELRPVFSDEDVVMPEDIPVPQLFELAGICVADLVTTRQGVRGRVRRMSRHPAVRAASVGGGLRSWVRGFRGGPARRKRRS